MVVKVHVDTDFAGDPDDACAVAMLVAMADVELVGVTTTLEDVGRRAGCARHLLNLMGRPDIAVAAGAESTLTGGRFTSTWGDERHWPEPVKTLRSPPGAALDLLEASIDQGATLIAIGGFTNLAILEIVRPGILRDVPVVAMSGWFGPPATGLPQWGPETDFNTQVDIHAAQVVANVADLTLVPLPLAIRAWLRRGQLDRLRAVGPVGMLLADQSEAHGADSGFSALAGSNETLPADLVNFHWDPVTCAVAVGWSGVTIERTPSRIEVSDGVLRFVDDPAGIPVRRVSNLDGEGFSEFWLQSLEQTQ